MLLLIAFAMLAIGVSFLCSILEAALLSITPSFIAQQQEQRPKLHDQLQALKNNIDRPLSAILTLNTVAHTAGAAGVGAQVGVVFGSGYLALASAVMTILILVLSEIIPKTIGAKLWRQLAPMLPVVLNFMILMLKPFIWLSDQITRRIGGEQQDIDVRSEIKALAIFGHQNKVIEDDEKRVISNILDLHTIRVHQVMTPRMVCEVVRPDESVANFLKRSRTLPYSRFPIIDEDEVPQGLLLRHEALEADDEVTLGSLARPLEVVTETLSIETVMTQFMAKRQHMAAVYDEHGSWLGLITMEDIIETILGQAIMDETDTIPSLRRYAKQRWGHRVKRNDDE